MATTTVSLAAIRRLAVSTQGYAPRFRRAQAGEVEQAIRRLSAVQLDSISAVDRAHRLTLSSRIGAYPSRSCKACSTAGRVFEYWAHEACLLPIELWPHCRRDDGGQGRTGASTRRALTSTRISSSRCWSGSARKARSARATSRAPATAPRCGTGSRRRGCSRRCGTAASSSSRAAQSFQRRYDLAERVIPRAILDAPTPDEDETLRTFALLAVRARGALTEPAIREHWRLKGGRARLHHHVLALVDEGLLREVDADDGGAPFYVDAERRARRRPGAARPALPLRQPGLGPAAARAALRLPPRDRGLQARARARVRLLRAAAARRRPDRRPRRPQGRPRGGRAARAALPPRAAACAGTSSAKLERAAARLARVLGLEEVRYA